MPLSNLRKGDSVIARKGSEKCPIYIFRPSTRYWLGNPPYISHRNPYSQRIERWHVARARIILEYGRTVSSRRSGACCALLEAGGGARLRFVSSAPACRTVGSVERCSSRTLGSVERCGSRTLGSVERCGRGGAAVRPTCLLVVRRHLRVAPGPLAEGEGLAAQRVTSVVGSR